MADIDMGEISTLLHRTAREKMLPYYGALKDGDIVHKEGDETNYVTFVDHKMQSALKKALGRMYPGTVFVGEEDVKGVTARYRNSVDLDGIRALRDAESVFLLDPLDGTWPFREGWGGFGTILAHVSKGECTHGWILDAPTGMIVTVEKGGGVYLSDMNTGASERKTLGAPSSPALQCHTYMPPEDITAQDRENFRLHGIEIGEKKCFSSVAAFHALIRGDFDFRVTHVYEFPWDIMAGNLMMAEAGGKAALLGHGKPYDPFEMNASMLWASSAELWERMDRVFAPMINERYFPAQTPSPPTRGRGPG